MRPKLALLCFLLTSLPNLLLAQTPSERSPDSISATPRPTWDPQPAEGARARVRFGAAAGDALPTYHAVRTEQAAPLVDVIVQFHGAPALASTSERKRLTARAVIARREALEARMGEFRGDLARIVSAAHSIAASSAEEPEQRDIEPRFGPNFSTLLYGTTMRGVTHEMRGAIERLPYVASVHIDQQFAILGSVTPNVETAIATRAVRANTGSGVVVAVIDTGVDYRHSALGGGMGPGFKVIGGWDFANSDADPLDDHGHGTHVAGIIAAQGMGLTGVAPDVSLLAYKVTNPQGFASSSAIIAAIERTVDPNQDGDPSDHADVVNISMGGPAQEDDPTAKAIELATAAGVLFTVANGNHAQLGYGALPTPAMSPSAISVGASDAQDRVASFSSRGPAYDYGIKPEVVAPGVDILSTFPGEKTRLASGTSMAAPYVAGVAALLRAQHPDWSPAEVKAAIIATAANLPEDVMTVGGGRVDSDRAAQTATLALPAVVNFGQVDTSRDVWSTSRTVTLRNVSPNPQSLTATISGTREGINVRIVPANVTLNPGESRTVTIEMSVTNSLLPAPKTGSLSFEGEIVWTGDGARLELPWATVKAAFLTVHAPEAGEFPVADAVVLSDTKQHAVTLWTDRTRIFLPLGKADVLVILGGNQKGWFGLAAEQVTVEHSPAVRMPLDEAQFTVAADTTDELGRELFEPGRGCAEFVLLNFPHGILGFGQSTQFRINRWKLSRLSSRVAVYVAHQCADGAISSFYAALHEPFRGLDANVTSTLRPRWRRQDLRFAGDVASPDGTTILGTAIRLTGQDGRYSIVGGPGQMMPTAGSSFSLYFNEHSVPEARLAVGAERVGQCSPDVNCPIVAGAVLLLDNEKITVDPGAGLSPEASPVAYEVGLRREPLTFGGRRLWPYARFGTAPVEDVWGASIEWRGPLGEVLPHESSRSSVAVYDASGKLIAEGAGGFLRNGVLAPGRYRLQAVHTGWLGGVRDTATYIGESDTSKADPMAPVFTSMRIVDDSGEPAVTLGRNSAAHVLFSAADRTFSSTGSIRAPFREAATRVEYRAHRSQEWHSLTPLPFARQYGTGHLRRDGVGTAFRVDLSTVTRQLIGPVDLRVHIEDDAGNTAELRLEPAFTVSAPRRRAAGH